uniref:Adenylate kinase n=1 Tax=Guillardia theta TaxID=55529 RepID=A0A7S4L659_GUITH
MRADVLKDYASKQSVGATLRQLLNRLLIKQPDDPVLYMINSLENWHVLKVCVLGPPGSGKKTLCEMLSRRLGLEHVCPADIASGFSDTAKQNGKEQSRQIRDGQESLQELILERLKDASCEEKGWIIDSWPQNVEQADRMIREGCSPQILIRIEVSDRIVEDRITFRTLHVPTGRVYHYMLDPPPLGEAHHCVQRQGESSTEVLERIKAYRDSIVHISTKLAKECGTSEIEIDGQAPLENYEDISDSLARKIGI